MSQHWEDHDDEGREMFVRQLAGRDPWEPRRANTRLCWWLALSIALNLAQTVLLLALTR